MTSSALITHVLDPLIDPQHAEQDQCFDKAFNSSDDQIQRDCVRGFKRCGVYAMDWAGDKLLLATKDNSLRLVDPATGDEERSWSGEWMSIQADRNNPFVVAAVGWTGKFRIFDVREHTKTVIDCDLKKTQSSMKDFLVLSWSPDSKSIAVNNRSDHIYIFDLRTSPLQLSGSRDMKQEVNQMVWSNDGESLWVATGGTPGKIHVCPTPNLAAENSTAVVAHQHTTIALASDPSGKYIASSGGDCLVTLWDPRHLVCVRTFGYATQAVTTIGFNRSGSLLAWGTGGPGSSSGGEKNLTIVGSETGTLYWQDSTAAPVQLVRWHPTRHILAYTLNVNQLPEERDRRGGGGRDTAMVHMLKVPDNL